MNICYTKAALKKVLDRTEVGFVPTMGALHSGHLSLIKKSKSENELTVCSIFVNPTQFNNREDFEKYPITLEKDKEMLASVYTDVLFLPSVEEMYPKGLKSHPYNFGPLANVMEGAFRPGHFDGVGTIVSTLFKYVNPTRAYFGEKDYQQLCIIKKLVEIEQHQIQIIGCPTLREKDGLAMSSRNMRLSPAQRAKAPFIYQVLQQVQKNHSNTLIQELKNWVTEQFNKEPDFTLEYFEIAHAETLQILTDKDKPAPARAFIVALIGGVRLIDNISLNPE